LGISLLLSALGIGNASATVAAVIANSQQEVDHSFLNEIGVTEGHSSVEGHSSGSYLDVVGAVESQRRRKQPTTPARRRRRTPNPTDPLEIRVSKLEKELKALRKLVTHRTVSYNGYEYRTVMNGVAPDGVAADGSGPGSIPFSPKVCHSKVWRPMPDGYEVAPETPDVVRNVVSKHTWSTHLVVLRKRSDDDNDDNDFPAYRTGAPQRSGKAGDKFGNDDPKAEVRTGDAADEYLCPHNCYQILIRRATTDARRRRRS